MKLVKLKDVVFYPDRAELPPLPLVMIHGAGGNHQHFLGLARYLKDVAGCVPVDLPGHGRHAGPARPALEGYAEALVSGMDELGLSQVVLLGHSMGGGVALSLALRYPARVKGLVLLGTGGRLKVNPAVKLWLETDFEAFLAKGVPLSFGSGAPRHLVESAQKAMGLVSRELLLNDFGACDVFDVLGRLREIPFPALAVCGDQDHLTPPKYTQYLVDYLPRGEGEILPGVGHMLMMEATQTVAEKITSFYQRNFKTD